jgi:hypothetical protein
MALIYKQNMNANGGRVLLPFTITDASVISVGEAVKLASGKVVTWGVGGEGLGIVASIRKADGSPLTDNGAGGDFVDTYTAPTSNTVVAMVDVSLDSIYSVTQDATLGTTTGSGLAGYNTDLLSTSLGLDESTTVSTTASFCIVGVDPDFKAPSNSVLVKIQESQFKL